MLMIFLGVCRRSPGGERRKRQGGPAPRGGPAWAVPGAAGPMCPGCARGRQQPEQRGGTGSLSPPRLRPGRRGGPPRAVGSVGSPGSSGGSCPWAPHRGRAAKGTAHNSNSSGSPGEPGQGLVGGVWGCVSTSGGELKADYVPAGGAGLGQGPRALITQGSLCQLRAITNPSCPMVRMARASRIRFR